MYDSDSFIDKIELISDNLFIHPFRGKESAILQVPVDLAPGLIAEQFQLVAG